MRPNHHVRRPLARVRHFALDASDLVESFLDDQARVNAAIDAGDINNTVGDVSGVTGEVVGMQADALATSTTTPPHNWGDGQSAWGFTSWG